MWKFAITAIAIAVSNNVAHADRILAITIPQFSNDKIGTYQKHNIGTTFQTFNHDSANIVVSTRNIISIDTDDPISEMEELEANPLIAAAAPDLLSEPLLLDAVPSVGAKAFHDLGLTGRGKTIAVLDTGVDRMHPMLKGKIVSEACFGTNDRDRNIFSMCPAFKEKVIGRGAAQSSVNIFNSYFHGTHVAAIAAGHAQEYLGSEISGVAMDAKIVAVNVFSKYVDPVKCFPNSSPCLRSTTRDQMRALFHIFELRNQYDISAVVMSLGAIEEQGFCATRPMKYVIEMLSGVGIPVVAASGNDGSLTALRFPACFSGTFSAAHSDKKGEIISMTANRSETLDIVAPGEGIVSAVPSGGYLAVSGSSQAAPMVAGALALLAEKFDNDAVENSENRNAYRLARLKWSMERLSSFARDANDPRQNFKSFPSLWLE